MRCDSLCRYDTTVSGLAKQRAIDEANEKEQKQREKLWREKKAEELRQQLVHKVRLRCVRTCACLYAIHSPHSSLPHPLTLSLSHSLIHQLCALLSTHTQEEEAAAHDRQLAQHAKAELAMKTKEVMSK